MKENWPICERTVHLEGGLIANIAPQSDIIYIWPEALDSTTVTIKIPTFGRLYHALDESGFTIVGVDFITNQGELTGEYPPQFRGYTKQNSIWHNFDAFQLWSNLSLSAFNHKDGLGYDLSKRVSYQLNTLKEKLRTLSSRYQDQLNAQIKKDKFQNGRRFEDGYTNLVYQEFHSFLFDAGILRDYLSEYVYNYSSGGTRKEQEKEITTAGGLLKVLKRITEPTELELELKKQMTTGGWLYELGHYRDLVMHSAPINIAENTLYAIQLIRDFSGGKFIPAVRFPLPEDPESLYKKRSKRTDFDKYIEQFHVLSKKSLNEDGKYDCLEYAHKIHGKLSNLASDIAKISPYKPMQMKITKTNTGTVTSFEYLEES